MNFCENVRWHMNMKRISQKELSASAGVSQPMISDLINGKVKDVGLERAMKIAKALGVSLDVLAQDIDVFVPKKLEMLRGNRTYSEYSAELEQKGSPVGIVISTTLLKEYEKGNSVPQEPILKYIAKVEDIDISYFYSDSSFTPDLYKISDKKMYDMSFLSQDMIDFYTNPDNANILESFYKTFKLINKSDDQR